MSGPPKVPSPILEVSPPEADEGVDRLVVDEPVFADYAQVRRSPQELFKVIKDLMNRRFQDIERVFYELDEINSERLSQEMMFQLLKRYFRPRFLHNLKKSPELISFRISIVFIKIPINKMLFFH